MWHYLLGYYWKQVAMSGVSCLVSYDWMKQTNSRFRLPHPVTASLQKELQQWTFVRRQKVTYWYSFLTSGWRDERRAVSTAGLWYRNLPFLSLISIMLLGTLLLSHFLKMCFFCGCRSGRTMCFHFLSAASSLTNRCRWITQFISYWVTFLTCIYGTVHERSVDKWRFTVDPVSRHLRPSPQLHSPFQHSPEIITFTETGANKVRCYPSQTGKRFQQF